MAATDVFRPCLPVDPFDGIEPGPWKPSISPHADPPSAVLVLGDPAPADLYPILFSQSLAQSLVVLATHAPPHIPQTPVTAVRILRLSSPLVQDAGALRLVGLLERADRVVRRFRGNRAELSRKLVQLTENSATGEFDVEEVYSPAEPPSPSRRRMNEDVFPRYPSPAPSGSSSLSATSTFSNSSSSSTFSRRRRAEGAGAKSSQQAADRAFDAIINFLPSSLPDKLLLKHAILVSTLTSSFCAAPPALISPPSAHAASAKSKQRSSIFSTLPFSSSDAHFSDSTDQVTKQNSRRVLLRRSQHNDPHPGAWAHSAPCSRDSLPLLAPSLKGKSPSQLHLHPSQFQRKAHLIHILPEHVYQPYPTSTIGAGSSSKKPAGQKPKPRPKPKLVQSIEQFLLAFGYPLQSMSLLPNSAAAAVSSSLAPGSRRISAASTVSSSFMSTPAFAFGFGMGLDDGVGGKPVPFLLPAGVLGTIPAGGRLSIGEILLMGGLDETGVGVGDDFGDAGMGPEEGRVWIGSPDDVVWDIDPGSLNMSNLTRSNSREVAFVTSPTSSPLLSQPQPQVTRNDDGSIHAPKPAHPSSWRSSSAPVAIPRYDSKSTIPSSLVPGSQLPPPPLASSLHTPSSTPSLNRPPSMIKASTIPSSTKRASNGATRTSSGLAHGGTNKQLPTPPESASSLEDDHDDEMTETSTTTPRPRIPSAAASTTEHHRYSYAQQQQKQQRRAILHYVKAKKSDLGHDHPGSNSSSTATGKTKGKGFMAKLGLGKGGRMFGKKSVKSGRATD